MESRLASDLNSDSLEDDLEPWLHHLYLPSARITLVHQYGQFMLCWALKPGQLSTN